MVSEAVQTSFHRPDCPRHMENRQSTRRTAAGAFSPESQDPSAENRAPGWRRVQPRSEEQRARAKAGQCECNVHKNCPGIQLLLLTVTRSLIFEAVF